MIKSCQDARMSVLFCKNALGELVLFATLFVKAVGASRAGIVGEIGEFDGFSHRVFFDAAEVALVFFVLRLGQKYDNINELLWNAFFEEIIGSNKGILDCVVQDGDSFEF